MVKYIVLNFAALLSFTNIANIWAMESRREKWTNKLRNAISGENLKDAALALSNGADALGKYLGEQTFINYAVTNNKPFLVRLLITMGKIDVNMIVDPKNGHTLLHLAVMDRRDRTKLIHVLLNLGANPNRQNRSGQNVLHCAVISLNLENVRAIIEHQGPNRFINFLARNNDGRTALEDAQQRQPNNPKIAAYIIRKNSPCHIRAVLFLVDTVVCISRALARLVFGTTS